jgi:hypothetical protein
MIVDIRYMDGSVEIIDNVRKFTRSGASKNFVFYLGDNHHYVRHENVDFIAVTNELGQSVYYWERCKKEV